MKTVLCSLCLLVLAGCATVERRVTVFEDGQPVACVVETARTPYLLGEWETEVRPDGTIRDKRTKSVIDSMWAALTGLIGGIVAVGG